MYCSIIDIDGPFNDVLWRITACLKYGTGLHTIQHFCSPCSTPIYTGGKNYELGLTA